MGAVIDFSRNAMLFKNQGSLDLVVNTANHYKIQPTPPKVTKNHERNIWTTREIVRREIPRRGVGMDSPNVIHPVEFSENGHGGTVEGVGKETHRRNLFRPKARAEVIPPDEAFPVRDASSSSNIPPEAIIDDIGIEQKPELTDADIHVYICTYVMFQRESYSELQGSQKEKLAREASRK